MSVRRIRIDLAIPERADGTLSPSNEGKVDALFNHIITVKAISVKINPGFANEENTIKATYHICRHDEGKACDPEVEILGSDR